MSPTGTHVVSVANNQLYLRALDELEAQPLTERSPQAHHSGGGGRDSE